MSDLHCFHNYLPTYNPIFVRKLSKNDVLQEYFLACFRNFFSDFGLLYCWDGINRRNTTILSITTIINLLVGMKKLATILLMLMFVLSSGYAINQKVQPGERVITFARPSTPVVFIAQQKYIKPFSTLAFRYDTILYIDSTQRPLI